jgi:hypothetical protein
VLNDRYFDAFNVPAHVDYELPADKFVNRRPVCRYSHAMQKECRYEVRASFPVVAVMGALIGEVGREHTDCAHRLICTGWGKQHR